MSAPAIPTFDEFTRKQENIPTFDEFSKGGGEQAKESPGFLKTYLSDLNPMNLAGMIRHPIDTLKNSFGPGAWVTPEEGIQRGANAPLSEMAGHAAAILTVPALMKSPAAIRAVKTVAPGAIRGGWDAATAPSTFRIKGTPVQVPVPASVATGGLGYEVGRHIPFVNPEVGGAVGGAVGAATPFVRGAIRGGVEAWRNRPQPVAPGPALLGSSSIFNMPGASDTSGPTGKGPTILEREPLPPSRQISSGKNPTPIVTPPPEDTSGVIPGWKPTVLPNEKATSPQPISSPKPSKPPIVFGDPKGFEKLPQSVQDAYIKGESVAPAISSPKPSPATIQVPAQGAADVVERVEHPPFAPDRPFPISQKIREQTPAAGTPDTVEFEAKVERLRRAFPWETDQQLRARAGHSNVMNRISATPGALDKMQKLKESLGGK